MMVLNVEGFEIEIRGESFVSIDDGARSQFCEWRILDPKLQDAFRKLAEEFEVALERFVTSDVKIAFDSIAEHYEPASYACSKAVCAHVG